jgi:RHS repeat-associated protein
MPLYTYTGQASYMDDPSTSGVTEGFGLMFYNARWYDPSLGRFAQADTMIPQSQGVQALDRYAYGSNNPSRFTDPTGHSAWPGDGGGESPKEHCDLDCLRARRADKAILTYALAGIATESPLGNTRSRGFVTNWFVLFIHKLITGDTEIGIGPGKIYDSEMGSGNSRYPGLGLDGIDQNTPAGALLGMEKRISLRLDRCVDCSD